MNKYVKILRIDHWFKNVFMLPGFALALLLIRPFEWSWFLDFVILVVATCLSASANYTINEYLDRRSDKHHPVKSLRPGARGLLDGVIVYVNYVALALASVGLSMFVGRLATILTVVFLLAGLAYNVPPVRLKDRAGFDVLWESINNPLRFLLGWAAAAKFALPPSSILLAYWMGGAFLMGVKRYAEYRAIGNPKRARRYRLSFGDWTEHTLLLFSFFCALCSVFFLGIFLIKYRIEFLLTFPLFALLFTWYLSLALKGSAAAQAPERLWKEGRYLAFVGVLVVAIVILSIVDIPALQILLNVLHY